MKKLTLLVKTLVAASVLAVQVNVVHALPTLQLDIGGGTYNASDESTFASSQIFNLFALLDTSKKNSPAASDDFYVSIALAPKTGTAPANLGSFVFNGATIYAASDMTFGVPTTANSTDSLQTHGIFNTFFTEIAFQFIGAGNQKVTGYNVQSDVGDPVANAAGTLIAHTFNVDTTNLDSSVALHFDLYHVSSGVIDKFAPFSHDARSKLGGGGGGGNVGVIPEPAILALFGLGSLGMGLVRRRRS